MSRLGITYEAVLEAAFDLHNNGEIPTIEKIRSYLGGTGSNTTISKYLQSWRQQMTIGKNQSEKSPTPEVVQTAVNSVWQQMREQTDAEIDKIKEETNQQIEEAQNQAIAALEERQMINQQYLELQTLYNAVSAEKEILTLDIKKFREEHTLLQERYKGLDERYTDMQGMAAQQLKIASDGHQKEITRLEETVELQKLAHLKLVDEIKDQSEQERHRQMLAIENLKVDNKKLEKEIKELQTCKIENNKKLVEIESGLKSVEKERDNVIERLADQSKQWQIFNNQMLVSDVIVNKLYDLPELEKAITYIDKQINNTINLKLTEFKGVIDSLIKQLETENE